MENRQRTRLVSVLILAVVFGAGLVVGLAMDRTALATPPADVAVAETDEPEEPGERERRPMYEQVGELTDDQRTRIDAIVVDFRSAGSDMREAHEREMAPIRERWDTRFDSLVEATRADIKAVMTAEQAQRYDSLIADYEKRREERRMERDSTGARRE